MKKSIGRISIFCRLLSIGAWIGAALSFATAVWLLLLDPADPDGLINIVIDERGEFASQVGRHPTILSGIPATLIGCYLFLLAARLFTRFSKGEIFTRTNSKLFKNFAIWNVVLVPTTVVVQKVWLIIWGIMNSAEITIGLSIEADFVSRLGLALTFMVISWVFDTAIRKNEEYELIF